MHRQLLAYRLALRLYPKTYRQQYREQMVQTVIDMLDDQSDVTGKSLVWMRIWCELPLSIVRENITTFGGAAMNKLTMMSDKRLVTGLTVVLLGVMFFALPPWLRTTVTPKIVSLSALPEVSRTLQQEQKSIGEPISKFYSYMPEEDKNCNLGASQGIKMAVLCQSSVQAYVLLPQNTLGEQTALADVKLIESALQKQGYVSGSNGVTFTSLVEGAYQGKDYSPDAYYEKQTGEYRCVFDTTIAYANPKPAAINLRMSCVRAVYVFGGPSQPTDGPVRAT